MMTAQEMRRAAEFLRVAGFVEPKGKDRDEYHDLAAKLEALAAEQEAGT